MIKNSFVVFLLVCFVACAEPEPELQPRISEEILVDLLADMHTADVLIENMRIKETDVFLQYKNSFFQDILTCYNVNQEEFDETYDFYSSELNKFQELYDKVLEEMSIRQAEYSK